MTDTFSGRALQYMRALLAEPRFAFTPEDAAAIVGNLAEESGAFRYVQELHPVAGRGGLGDGQWTGPRRVAFEVWLKRKGFDVRTFEANYSFLFRELVGPEAHAVSALRGAQGLYNKVVAFERAYERAGVPAWNVRFSYAQRALALYETARKQAVDVSSTKPVEKATKAPETPGNPPVSVSSTTPAPNPVPAPVQPAPQPRKEPEMKDAVLATLRYVGARLNEPSTMAGISGLVTSVAAALTTGNWLPVIAAIPAAVAVIAPDPKKASA